MYLVISASPNSDGLTAACAKAAMDGFAGVGAQSAHLDLCGMELAHCDQCDNGWGTCRTEHTCVLNDDLAELQQAVTGAQGIVIVTPVYFGEMAESAKAAFDRLRRCEATKGEQSAVAGKPIIAVAAAGGSGGGITTCLLSMERLIQHMRGQVVDLIGITRRNHAHKLDAIRASAATMAATAGEPR